jgi:hypothetical protein
MKITRFNCEKPSGVGRLDDAGRDYSFTPLGKKSSSNSCLIKCCMNWWIWMLGEVDDGDPTMKRLSKSGRVSSHHTCPGPCNNWEYFIHGYGDTIRGFVAFRGHRVSSNTRGR